MSQPEGNKTTGNYQNFHKGEIVLFEGTVAPSLFVLLRGKAEAYEGYDGTGQNMLAQLGPGDFFGEASMLLGNPSTITVIAVTDITVLVIEKAALPDFFRSQPEQAVSLITAICRRLARAQELLGQGADTPFAHASAPSAPASAPAPSEAKAAPSAPSAPEAEAEPEGERSAAVSDTLFLPGHKGYSLKMSADPSYFYEKSCTCPQCGNKFGARAVKHSKLSHGKTDPDLRVRFAEVEPLYYDIFICPQCWFSALSDQFEKATRRREQIEKELTPFRAELFFPTGAETNADTVFAGYYLALACAPLCYPSPNLMLGKLWQKLSRVYADCEAHDLELACAQKALDAYMYAYTKTHVPVNQNQQLCVLLAELSLKLGNIKDARNFFFQAKTDASGTPNLKRHAEDRIEDIRAMGDEAETS